jgi:hypothetical protein
VSDLVGHFASGVDRIQQILQLVPNDQRSRNPQDEPETFEAAGDGIRAVAQSHV